MLVVTFLRSRLTSPERMIRGHSKLWELFLIIILNEQPIIVTTAMWERITSLDNQLTLRNDVIVKISDVTHLKCLYACATNSQCVSFFYRPSATECLLIQTFHFSINFTVPASGFQYWMEECPSAIGYQLIPNSRLCVRIDKNTSASYDVAVAACKGEKAELITFDGEKKFQILHGFLYVPGFPTGFPGNPRVAGVRRDSGGLYDFIYDSGKNFPFGGPNSQVWVPFQPNNLNKSQPCLALDASGVLLLHDVSCSVSCRGYICERLLWP